jgi:glycine C-acetyltransferase
MPADRLNAVLESEIAEIRAQGTQKGDEDVIVGILPAGGAHGPRVRLAGDGDRGFLKMSSNAYLGMSLRPEVIAAEEAGTRAFGAGPGAVRFISGTCEPHVELERALAAFHGREAGMIFSSAYATTLGVLVPLITDETVVVSDELNHNCIINAMRLARPKAKAVSGHLDLEEMEAKIEAAAGTCRRLIVVTDGIFSMRGDHAPLAEIEEIVRRWDAEFPENAILMIDDSHGVGACGATGRGTEEMTGGRADLVVGTLGKALGVNGGYVVGDAALVAWLREKAPLYIYSNPITPGEAAAARKALELLDSTEGVRLLDHLRAMTSRFEQGLVSLGFETIPGEHPVVPLMVRDTARTRALVRHLKENGILATGLSYPVVPRGDEEIRFQISADHSPADIDLVLQALGSFEG